MTAGGTRRREAAAETSTRKRRTKHDSAPDVDGDIAFMGIAFLTITRCDCRFSADVNFW
jgi:hypothetical protein